MAAVGATLPQTLAKAARKPVGGHFRPRAKAGETPLAALARLNGEASLDFWPELVPRHSDFDGLIWSHFRIGKCSGATSSSMLRGAPGLRLIKPARWRLTII
jgi:hypothetical protein